MSNLGREEWRVNSGTAGQERGGPAADPGDELYLASNIVPATTLQIQIAVTA
ncbi:MAG: hypothetical protein WCH39_13185 [Schlesneria sp.]